MVRIGHAGQRQEFRQPWVTFEIWRQPDGDGLGYTGPQEPPHHIGSDVRQRLHPAGPQPFDPGTTLTKPRDRRPRLIGRDVRQR